MQSLSLESRMRPGFWLEILAAQNLTILIQMQNSRVKTIDVIGCQGYFKRMGNHNSTINFLFPNGFPFT